MNNLTKIIIDFLIIFILLFGIIISFSILLFIYIFRQQYRITVPTLLICNTYISLILSAIFLLDMYIHNLYGDIYENVSFNDTWCYLRAYLILVQLSSIYFSFFLQALFRLFRIVFHQYRYLQTFDFIIRLIIFQWIFVYLIILPIKFLNYFQYEIDTYFCQIPLTNILGTIIGGLTVYHGPTMLTSCIYSYIIYYIKHRTNRIIRENHQQSYDRDLIVLRRILILISILLILLIPPSVLTFIYLATHYLHPLIYHIEWLTMSLSLLILPIAIIILNPQLRQLISRLFRRNNRIQPVVFIRP